MTNITFIAPNGTKHMVEAKNGHSIMETAIANDIAGITAECAGSLACATCHIFIDEKTMGQIAPPETDEEDMLDFVAVERRPTSRLSCQVQINESMKNAVFTIPERQT